MLRPCLLTSLLLVGAVAANAQGIPITDCSISCNSQILCSQWCTQDGGDSTCGNYGVCDPDPDGDGLDYYMDNCPVNANVNQADCDGDGLGDVCDVENALYETAEVRHCWYRHRVHLWGSDTTRFIEHRLEDESSCGAPDKWEKHSETTKNCIGSYAGLACCYDHWGAFLCDTYANNTCHY
jgi:hypothetical protein